MADTTRTPLPKASELRKAHLESLQEALRSAVAEALKATPVEAGKAKVRYASETTMMEDPEFDVIRAEGFRIKPCDDDHFWVEWGTEKERRKEEAREARAYSMLSDY